MNYINFITTVPGCVEDIMQTFFWLDEDNRNTFHLFQLVRNPGKCNVSDNKASAIMIAMKGQLMLLSVCGLIMVW